MTLAPDVLREELRPLGIGVSLVTPGAVNSPFFDRRHSPYERSMPKMIQADDVADATVDVIAHGKDHVIIPARLSIPARFKRNLSFAYRVLANRFGWSRSSRQVGINRRDLLQIARHVRGHSSRAERQLLHGDVVGVPTAGRAMRRARPSSMSRYCFVSFDVRSGCWALRA